MARPRKQRRIKSSVDRLPPEVRERVEAMLKDGRYTLDEMIDALRREFPTAQAPSRSALGRYSQRFDDIGARLRESREVAKIWVDKLGSEPQGDIGKLVMELLRTAAFDATLELQDARDEEGKLVLDPKAISTLALAVQRLEAAGKWNLQREKEIQAAALAQAADRVEESARAQGMGDDQARFWRDRVLAGV